VPGCSGPSTSGAVGKSCSTDLGNMGETPLSLNPSSATDSGHGPYPVGWHTRHPRLPPAPSKARQESGIAELGALAGAEASPVTRGHFRRSLPVSMQPSRPDLGLSTSGTEQLLSQEHRLPTGQHVFLRKLYLEVPQIRTGTKTGKSLTCTGQDILNIACSDTEMTFPLLRNIIEWNITPSR